MIRILYAFSWGNYPVFRDHYPNRPADLMVYNLDERAKRRLAQWLHNCPPNGYGKYVYYNIYSIFLFFMRFKGLIQ